jgi:O-antigen/teichoic acid export membrane protein
MNEDNNNFKDNQSRYRGITVIGLSDTIGSVIAAIFWFYVATLLTPEQYGELFFVLGIAGTASLISIFGTENTLTVYVAKKVKIQATLYFLSLIIGIISSLIIIIFFYRIDATLVLIGYIINSLAIGSLLGRKQFSSYAKYILIQKILTLVLGLTFYYAFGVDGILYALALSYSFFIIRIYKEFRSSKIDFSLLRSRFGFVTNNYVLRLSGGLIGNLDKLIIAPIMGFAILGNYSLTMQILSIMMMLPHIVFKYTLTHDASGSQNLKIKKITILASIGIVFLGITVLPHIIPILFPKYIDVIDAIRIMSLAVIPYTLTLLFSSKLLGLEKSKFVLIEKITALCIMICGVVVLGPLYGIVGISVAFVLATSVGAVFLGYVIRAQR